MKNLTDEQRKTIAFAAEALEGLDYEDTAGELRAILASQQPAAAPSALVDAKREPMQAFLVHDLSRRLQATGWKYSGPTNAFDDLTECLTKSDFFKHEHPNLDVPMDPACSAKLDYLGDDRGQGLSGYWKWGFRAGWKYGQDAAAAPAIQQEGAALDERAAWTEWMEGQEGEALDECDIFYGGYRAALAALAAQAPVKPAQGDALSQQAATGTSACPICGFDQPHAHSAAEQQAYREDQIRNDGWASVIICKPEKSGWYLCRGVEIPTIHESNQKFWLNWVRQFMAETGSCRDAKEIPEVLYYDKGVQAWALRNALGDAVHSGAESRYPVYVKITHWREVPATNAVAPAAQVAVPLDLRHGDEVIRHSDQSVRIRFLSARAASEFERQARAALAAPAPVQPQPIAHAIARMFGEEAAEETVKSFGQKRFQQGRAAGIEEAAQYLDGVAERYLQEHAETDLDTGAIVWEFGSDGRDYHSVLIEEAAAIRGIKEKELT